MKKKHTKGFMLVETLVCSVFLVAILVFVYIQFTNINQSYKTSFSYNGVNNLYLAEQAKKYLIFEGLFNPWDLQRNDYVVVDYCSRDQTNYCTTLFDKLNITTVIYANPDFKDNIPENLQISEGFKQFIKTVNIANPDNNIAYFEFDDESYALLEVKDEEIPV